MFLCLSSLSTKAALQPSNVKMGTGLGLGGAARRLQRQARSITKRLSGLPVTLCTATLLVCKAEHADTTFLVFEPLNRCEPDQEPGTPGNSLQALRRMRSKSVPSNSENS